MFGMWDVRDVGCPGCGMFGVWDVSDVGCLECGMFGMWDDRGLGYSGCGMFAGMRYVFDIFLYKALLDFEFNYWY